MIEYLANLNALKGIDITPNTYPLATECIEVGRYYHLVSPKSVWHNGATYITGYRGDDVNNAGCIFKWKDGNMEYAYVGVVDNNDPLQHPRPAVLIIDDYVYVLQVNGHGHEINIWKSNVAESIVDGFTLHSSISGDWGYLDARYIDGRIIIQTRVTSGTPNYSMAVLYSDVGDFTTWTSRVVTDAEYNLRDIRHYPQPPIYYGTNHWYYFIINSRADLTTPFETFFANSILKTKDFITYYNIGETFNKNVVIDGEITVDELQDNYTVFGDIKAFNKPVGGGNYIVLNDVVYGAYFDADENKAKYVKITQGTIEEKEFGTGAIMWYNGNNIVASNANGLISAVDLNFSKIETQTKFTFQNPVTEYLIEFPINLHEVTGDYIVGGARLIDIGVFEYWVLSDKFNVNMQSDVPTDITDLTTDAIFSTFIDVSWSASASTYGIGFYEVYLNGIVHGGTQNLNYTVDGLTLGVEYDIRVKAVSASGVRSNFSNTLIETTAYGVPIANIISYWEMDTDSLDQVGTNNGVDTAMAYNAPATTLVGNAASFLSSSASRINIPTSLDLNFGDGTNDSPFSISLWVYWDTIVSPTTPYLFMRHATNFTDGQEYYLIKNASNNLRFALKDQSAGATVFVDNTWTPTTATWHHIAVTYDGRGGADAADGMNIYRNGVLTVTSRTNNASYVAMEDLGYDNNIGRSPHSSATRVSGHMDEIVPFNKELSASEVLEIYNKGLAGLALTA